MKESIKNKKESEDERIRNEIINFLRSPFVNENIADEKVAPWLSWLEKQKEQKPSEPSDEELERHQKELYDFKVFAAKQAKEHHISFVHDFEWNNFCAEILSYFNEQKPADFPTTDKEMRDFLDKTPPVEVPEKYKTADWLFDKMGHQPVEWSEEDETVEMSPYEAEFCQKFCGHTPDYYTSDGWKLIKKDYAEFKEIVMKELKQDWSEEDEEMLNLTKTQLRILQSHLSHAHSESMSNMEYSSQLFQIEKCVSWLDIRFKSLRPQLSPKSDAEPVDPFDTIRLFTDINLVQELRRRGYEVTAEKTIKL